MYKTGGGGWGVVPLCCTVYTDKIRKNTSLIRHISFKEILELTTLRMFKNETLKTKKFSLRAERIGQADTLKFKACVSWQGL